MPGVPVIPAHLRAKAWFVAELSNSVGPIWVKLKASGSGWEWSLTYWPPRADGEVAHEIVNGYLVSSELDAAKAHVLRRARRLLLHDRAELNRLLDTLSALHRAEGLQSGTEAQ